MKTIEEKRERRRNYMREVRKTEQYKEWRKAYEQSESGKKTIKKYRDSERGLNTRRQYRMNVRNNLIKLLGGKCSMCGLSDIRALELDHMNNDGKYHRDRLGGAINEWFYYIKHFDECRSILQVLCGSCHNIKTYNKLDQHESGDVN